MNNLINLTTAHFSLSEENKNLISDICKNIENKNRAEAVVNNLINFRLDFSSIVAYLLYEANSVLDIDLTDDVRLIYEGLSAQSIEGLDDDTQPEVVRKMFIAMSKDIRVVIIKLYVMLYDISQYKLPLTKEQYDILNDVRDIFAPLAERLGLNKIKSELEDCCLKCLNPKIYEELDSSVMLQKDANEKQIEITREKIEQIIKELNLENVAIMARQKHYSSIYKKLKSKNVTIANIYDLIAMRVIVNTIDECYAVLGKIHGIYKPMEGRFKDYIASPKPNGYQSLHTTIIVENKRPLEVQIRTHEMHKMSEFGVFAHFLYKEKKNKMSGLDKKISWLREIMESSKDLSNEEFVETLKTNLCEGQIYVQTPKGRVMEFVEGSTIIDFAYAIHSDIGNNCVGGKINGAIKPLSTKLKNGDIVEIITSPSPKGPSKDWLKFVKTSQARSKINYFFKKEFKEENIKLGISMLEQAIKTKGYSPNKLLVEKYLDPAEFKYAFGTKEELFASIGYGSTSALNVANRIISLYEQDNKILNSEIKQPQGVVVKQNKDGVLIDGDSGMLIRYAGCCSPVYGEDIVGYISRGRGVTIHRADCPNLKFLEEERQISAIWDEKISGRSTAVLIKIISKKVDNFVVVFTQTIVGAGYKILGLDLKENQNDKIITTAKIEVSKQEDLTKILKLVNDISSVEEAYRLGK
ncbi:MAG: bifunctional (p)ppGpp synthetase/guanosine-3',5'-bis(diphosphate) 3'-pyrophosphohydrolase [Clostridia bacterium]|nr:bifunctional (p)ppGpp synthetase/guanosine-3',5'-bis(diphosphate) 3'-pyrophosphohydrolase [Clostridia bacterium]